MSSILIPTTDVPVSTLSQRFAAVAPHLSRRLALTYGLLTPLVVLPLSRTEFAGAVDLLAPDCFVIVLLRGRLDRLQREIGNESCAFRGPSTSSSRDLAAPD